MVAGCEVIFFFLVGFFPLDVAPNTESPVVT